MLDTRQASALIRALGATPEQVTAGLCAAQVIPALAGIVLGIPGGIFLNMALRHGFMTLPPWWTLLVVVLGFMLAVIVLIAAPARLGARRSAAEYLQDVHAVWAYNVESDCTATTPSVPPRADGADHLGDLPGRNHTLSRDDIPVILEAEARPAPSEGGSRTSTNGGP